MAVDCITQIQVKLTQLISDIMFCMTYIDSYEIIVIIIVLPPDGVDLKG